MHDGLIAVTRQRCAEARSSGRRTLLEPDAFELVAASGLRVPRQLFVSSSRDAAALDLAPLGSARVVVKVVAPAVAHKSDVGGVAFVEATRDAVAGAIERMEAAFAARDVAGYSISEHVAFDPSLGGEWLLGMRWVEEYGPVLTIGAGGVAAEFLATVIQPGRDLAILRPGHTTRPQLEAAIERLALTPLVTGGIRRQPPRATMASLCEAVERFGRLAAVCGPGLLGDIEINPLAIAVSGPVALDVLAIPCGEAAADRPPRPLQKLRHLLRPERVAVAGVSARMNPGRVILGNLLREGFAPAALHVVKPGVDAIDGVAAVPDIRSLPQPVDLLVLSVSADQVPDALIEVVESRKAESVIVIPGGLEEKAGTEGLVSRARAALDGSRNTAWGGPVVNGGNCLGIQSDPGHYDTMFIPGYKLGTAPGGQVPREAAPVALISQSGAFAVSRSTRLAGIRPAYAITVGNQMDLTIGDYLTYLERDSNLKLFALYIEGFRPLDGAAALAAIERITATGRTVIAYRAGRTREGSLATASHTASLAGDYVVTRELLARAGAIVASTLEDFTDLVDLFTRLHGKAVWGRRVGVVSNAGYECVAIADSLGGLELAPLRAETVARLQATLDHARLGAIVDVHNPFDVTPMLGDEAFEAAVRAILDDPGVDIGVVGCVPATPALDTLPASSDHPEDLTRPGSIGSRLRRLHAQSAKPWIAVVDAGAIYDPLAEYLRSGGIPTFRTADRALRLLGVFADDRFAHTLRAQTERWTDEFGQPAIDPLMTR
jgi:acyl-CoA synthetase (NDP forming)